jgi:hypothetical protein
LQEYTANDGFHVAPALNAAGNVNPRLVRKGYQVEGVAGPQEFPEEAACHVIVYFPIGGAHARRGIQQHDQVYGPGVLSPHNDRD